MLPGLSSCLSWELPGITMRVGNVPVASQVGGHDHPQTPLKRVKRMKGKDRAGPEDLSVEPGFEHICQWRWAADEIETVPQPDRSTPSNSPLGTKLPPLSISHQQW